MWIWSTHIYTQTSSSKVIFANEIESRSSDGKRRKFPGVELNHFSSFLSLSLLYWGPSYPISVVGVDTQGNISFVK